MDLFFRQNICIEKQRSERCSQIVGHFRNHSPICPGQFFFFFYTFFQSPAHVIHSGRKIGKLILSYYRNLIFQIAISQNLTFFFQLSNIFYRFTDPQYRCHNKQRHSKQNLGNQRIAVKLVRKESIQKYICGSVRKFNCIVRLPLIIPAFYCCILHFFIRIQRIICKKFLLIDTDCNDFLFIHPFRQLFRIIGGNMVFCNIFLEIFDGMVTCFLYIITFIKIKCKQIFPRPVQYEKKQKRNCC